MNLTLGQKVNLIGQIMKGQFDVRQGSLVHSLFTGLWPSISGEPPKRQGKQYLETYNSMPLARTPISCIATSISMLNWRLFYRTDERQRDERGQPKIIRDRKLQRMDAMQRKSAVIQGFNAGTIKEVEDHILLNALCDGNAMLSGQACWKVSQQHVSLVGETFWLKERNALGGPVAFWPIPSYWIIDTPSPAFRFYKVSFRAWQGLIPDTEIVWIKDPDPANPYSRGSGIAQTLADELETDEYVSKFMKQFFFNKATPDFMIFPKGEMNNMGDDQVKRLERRWLDMLQGYWRAHRPHFMSREVGVYEFQKNFQHLQLNELRTRSRDISMQANGVNPEVVGIIENSNRSTIDGAFYGYHKLCISPWAEFWRSELQQKVVNDYDPRLIIDYDDPVQENQEFTLQSYQAKPSTVTVDEWRRLQKLPPIGAENGGNLRFQQINETLEAGFAEMPDASEQNESKASKADLEKVAALLKRMSESELEEMSRFIKR